jgi:hypothetical protein
MSHSVAIMVILILLVWRIGFGVTGMELVGAMSMVQGFVWCDAGSLWLVIIPWDGVGEAAMAEPIRHKRGLLGGCDAHASSETSVGTLQAR